ncbi:MAG: galactokinase [Actinomycetota bacterium]
MRAVAPGRVNLIGDHTDYTGGLVLPMAIDRYTVIDFEPVGRDTPTELTSDDTSDPDWRRYPEAVSEEMREIGLPVRNIRGHVTTTIPVGAGLSSSAALEIASALAFGHDIPPVELAQLARRAEHRATGVPTGIMDQLCIASAREGHATLIDCRSLGVTHVTVPTDVKFVVRFVAHRTLQGSEYADRVAQCTEIQRRVGPLRNATLQDIVPLGDDTLLRRARHVVTENARVLEFAAALGAGDFAAAGAVMTDGHRSLGEDYGTSNGVMDAAVDELVATPGVLGARMTGGGFGGCVVAMCEPDAVVDGWVVRPVGAARITD